MRSSGKLFASAGLAAAILCPAAGQAQTIGLPISTSVNVTNTPGVNVVNTPGVTVNNAAGSPVPVYDVKQAAIQPVSGECSAIYGTVSNTKQCTLYTVPAGKRLVVETVVYEVAIENGGFPYAVTYLGSAGSAFYSFAPTLVGNDGVNHYANASPTRFYLSAGETLSVYTQFSAATILGQRFCFSGYLVNQ
jgi:hypothetical protein